jgi:hypothetical protein
MHGIGLEAIDAGEAGERCRTMDDEVEAGMTGHRWLLGRRTGDPWTRPARRRVRSPDTMPFVQEL